MEIVPGVHRVGKTRGGNVYLLVDNRLTLIDAGMPGGAEGVLSFIRALGRDPGELGHIIITHGHVDHAGGAAELRRLTGASVVAHDDEGARMPDGSLVLRGDLNGETGPLVRAMSRFGRFEPCPVDTAVSDGDLLHCAGGIRVVHAPGHTRGSMALLLEERGVLFVGDAIISNRDRLSRPLPFGTDRAESERSLAKLAQLEFEVCCFGHGPALTSGARDAVANLAGSPPQTPLWQRIFYRRGDLARFGVRLFRE
jgi:glyoxylase-like metal-dependent hydrolase (beta-lactamase superfamily II)